MNRSLCNNKKWLTWVIVKSVFTREYWYAIRASQCQFWLKICPWQSNAVYSYSDSITHFQRNTSPSLMDFISIDALQIDINCQAQVVLWQFYELFNEFNARTLCTSHSTIPIELQRTNIYLSNVTTWTLPNIVILDVTFWTLERLNFISTEIERQISTIFEHFSFGIELNSFPITSFLNSSVRR